MASRLQTQKALRGVIGTLGQVQISVGKGGDLLTPTEVLNRLSAFSTEGAGRDLLEPSSGAPCIEQGLIKGELDSRIHQRGAKLQPSKGSLRKVTQKVVYSRVLAHLSIFLVTLVKGSGNRNLSKSS